MSLEASRIYCSLGNLPLEGCSPEDEADDERLHLTSDGDVDVRKTAMLTLCGKRVGETGYGEALMIAQWLDYGLCEKCAEIARTLIARLEDED